MSKDILINVGIGEVRVAILEDGILVEFSVERADEAGKAGNIYRGRVKNVLPGMQAAFVDIGEEKNAFLYIDDVIPRDMDSEHSPDPKHLSIQNLLHEGQEITVQMIKEPIGSKGPRVVTQITIPGRYLVFLPLMDYVGVSRRIESESERERLKTMVGRFRTPGTGVIVRTAAEDCDLAELQSEYEFLLNLWKKIQKKTKKNACPALLYRDHDLIYRVLRDYLSKDVDRLLIDDTETFSKALDLVKSLAPSLKNRVQLYADQDLSLFSLYQIESQLEKALRRKIWLDCGAYLVFDQTEALTVIDVNTGKFTGTTCLEDTVFLTNQAAVEEIARQIRLRNLAGIILIDFIDMTSDGERAKIIDQLTHAFERDRTKANILGFTALGLLEVTRKKVKQSLREILQVECQTCEGTGYVISPESLAQNVIRTMQQIAHANPSSTLLFGVHPEVGSLLIGPGGVNLEKTERNLNKMIFIKGMESIGREQVKLLASGSREEVEAVALPVREGEEIELRVAEPHITNHGDGIARLEGYIVNIEGGGAWVGKTVRVFITKTFKTYARGKIVH